MSLSNFTIQLTPEQMGERWQELMRRAGNFFPSRKDALLGMYRDNQRRLATMPASTKEGLHNCFPGGYVDHILRVMDYAQTTYETWIRDGLDVSNFTEEEMLFVAMHHDLGKMGLPGEGNELYVLRPAPSKWELERGMLYDINERIPFAYIPHRSLFLLQHYGITLSQNEWFGIMLHDGLYEESNDGYFLASEPKSRLRTNLVQIVHEADYRAARFEFERWRTASGKVPMGGEKPVGKNGLLTRDAQMPVSGRAGSGVNSELLAKFHGSMKLD
jgi:hypothetical protein